MINATKPNDTLKIKFIVYPLYSNERTNWSVDSIKIKPPLSKAKLVISSVIGLVGSAKDVLGGRSIISMYVRNLKIVPTENNWPHWA